MNYAKTPAPPLVHPGFTDWRALLPPSGESSSPAPEPPQPPPVLALRLTETPQTSRPGPEL
ncbi:hypothetical protein EYF80_063693 [Liparis tanakae]|uniref:Uncharacterized protein n=1 Tax=Liparis tanakae TaxID=230148 RepID=A0A4Z2EC73_9TELE|nr:hypothetical protein EYF80_063693 [Liparis tanakae]